MAYPTKPFRKHKKYPWDLWMDGRTVTVTRDDLFGSSLGAFQVRVYRTAKKYGRTAHCSLKENTLTFYATKD